MVAEHRNDKPAEVRLTNETIDYLKQITNEAVKNGIKDGLKEAINEETASAFWAAGFNALQKQATNHAGRFVIGGITGIFSKLFTFLALGGLVYAIGGWAALAKMWHGLWAAS